MAEQFNPVRPLDFQREEVSMELKDILIVNQAIINNLKVQKARLDMSYDRYRTSIESEAKRPSNRFLEWTKILVPYQEMVTNSKVTDYELLKAYDNFVSQLIKHDKTFVIRKEELDVKDEVIADLINKTIVSLEQELIKIRRENEKLKAQMGLSSASSASESQPSESIQAVEMPPNTTNCKVCGKLKPSDDGYASCKDCRDRMKAQRRARKNEQA